MPTRASGPVCSEWRSCGYSGWHADLTPAVVRVYPMGQGFDAHRLRENARAIDEMRSRHVATVEKKAREQ